LDKESLEATFLSGGCHYWVLM